MAKSAKQRNLTAERIASERDKLGYSQRQLGDAVGVGTGTVSHWEQGLKNPRPKTLELLSHLFNVSVDYLLGLTCLRSKSDQIGREAANDVIKNEIDLSAVRILEMFKQYSTCVIPVVTLEGVHDFVLRGRGRMTEWDGETILASKNTFGAINEDDPPFAVIANKDMPEWSIYSDFRVVINPSETINNYDVALIFYRNKPALKKVHFLPGNEVDLIAPNGNSIKIIASENTKDIFKIAGKAVKIIADIKHGI